MLFMWQILAIFILREKGGGELVGRVITHNLILFINQAMIYFNFWSWRTHWIWNKGAGEWGKNRGRVLGKEGNIYALKICISFIIDKFLVDIVNQFFYDKENFSIKKQLRTVLSKLACYITIFIEWTVFPKKKSQSNLIS